MEVLHAVAGSQEAGGRLRWSLEDPWWSLRSLRLGETSPRWGQKEDVPDDWKIFSPPQVVATGWTSPEAPTALRHSRLSTCLESHSQHSTSFGSERPQLQDVTDLPFTQTVSSKLSRGELPKCWRRREQDQIGRLHYYKIFWLFLSSSLSPFFALNRPSEWPLRQVSQADHRFTFLEGNFSQEFYWECQTTAGTTGFTWETNTASGGNITSTCRWLDIRSGGWVRHSVSQSVSLLIFPSNSVSVNTRGLLVVFSKQSPDKFVS